MPDFQAAQSKVGLGAIKLVSKAVSVTPSPILEKQVEDLLAAMKSTAGSRFAAAKRLEDRDQELTRLTGFTSAYVIVLTILPFFITMRDEVEDWLALITVGFSIVILIASLLQYSNRDTVNAEQHHRSALEIGELRRKLKIDAEGISKAALMDYSQRYSNILQKFSVNHDDIDYQKYQIDRPEEFKWLKWPQRWWIRAKLTATKYIPSVTLLVVSVILVLILVKYVLPMPKLHDLATSARPPL